MEEHKILVVDDEIANLQKLRRTFINRYPVLAASSGKEALQLVEQNNNIAVIVADQRMPDMTGVEFLRHTLVPLPHAIRIILTGFTDVDVLMEAINSCKVFRYMVKPWDPPDLLMTVERGLEAHQLAVENERFRRELVAPRAAGARTGDCPRDSTLHSSAGMPCDRELRDGGRVSPLPAVGGDRYDFDWDPATGMLQIVIGDVSGKSIPAALCWGGIQRPDAHAVRPLDIAGSNAWVSESEAGQPVSGRELHSRGPPLSQRRRWHRTSGQWGNALSLSGSRRSGIEAVGWRSASRASGRVGVRRNRADAAEGRRSDSDQRWRY